MKFRQQLSSVLVLVLMWSGAAQAQLAAPSPPDIKAKGYLLMDFNSGRILAQTNASERLDPASITKLMTAIVVLRQLRSMGTGQKPSTDNKNAHQ